MDLRVFDNSPQVVPLLVRLYESQKLYQLAHDKRPVAKAELSAAITELLEVKLSAREQELLTDVLIALARQAETDLRQALAERLAVIDNVPLRLILWLVNDEFSVAAPVLRKSTVLSDLDLIYIVKAQGPEYWHAIAAREDLSPQVIDVLAETRDHGTAVTLSGNERITLTSYAIDILAELAMASSDIARPLLARPEIPQRLARSLYHHVGEELKTYIEGRFDFDHARKEAKVQNAIEDIVLEFASDEPAVSAFYPTEAMLADARERAQRGLLNLNVMIDHLTRGQIASFIAMFSSYTGLPAQRIHDAVLQTVPKGLAIICRAFNVPKSEFSRIFLLTNRARTGGKLVDHAAMLEVLGYFDKISPAVARRVIRRETTRPL